MRDFLQQPLRGLLDLKPQHHFGSFFRSNSISRRQKNVAQAFDEKMTNR